MANLLKERQANRSNTRSLITGSSNNWNFRLIHRALHLIDYPTFKKNSLFIPVKYRSRTDIVSEILKMAENGNSKTKIMYGAYLSYAQLKDYMTVMLENRLIEKRGVKYQTTKKGLEFLRQYEHLGGMLELVQPKSD